MGVVRQPHKWPGFGDIASGVQYKLFFWGGGAGNSPAEVSVHFRNPEGIWLWGLSRLVLCKLGKVVTYCEYSCLEYRKIVEEKVPFLR